MANEIKPLKPLDHCKFCGGTDLEIVKTNAGTKYMCRCRKCGAHSKSCKSLLWVSTLWNQSTAQKIEAKEDAAKQSKSRPIACRFCGESDINVLEYEDNWHCVCSYCGAAGPEAHDADEAIKKWNM